MQNGLNALRESYRFSRPLEARITGGFAYQPYERQRGGAQVAEIDRDQLSYALAELTRAVASDPTGEERHALGRLYLLTGDFDQAEEQLTLALKNSPRNGKLHADIAALYYERSKFADPFPFLSKAIEHYNSAIEFEPQLAEAWFNRALCREQMSLFTEAQKDWERYLEIDPNSPWATEAREHLKRLRARASQSPDQKKQEQLIVNTAVEKNNENEMRQVVSQHFVRVNKLATEKLFDEYLDAAINGDETVASAKLSLVKHIGDLAAEIKGDRYITDLTDFATRASPSVKQGLQHVRLVLRQADEAFNRGSLDTAYSLYSSAYQAANRIGDPCHSEIAALNLTRYNNHRTNSEALAQLSDQLIVETGQRQHRLLNALALLAAANALAGAQQFSRSLEYSLKAATIANELGDIETTINGLRFAGGAYSRSGDYERAVSKNFEAVSLLKTYSVVPARAAQACIQFSDTLFRMGDYNRAMDYQREAFKYANQTANAMLVTGVVGRLGLYSWKLGRQDEAMKYLTDAVTRAESIPDKTARPLLQIDLFTTLGDFYLQQNRVTEAVSAYQQAIKTIGTSNNRVFLSAIHQGLASAYLAQGKIAAAEAEFQTSIRLAERDRQQINNAYGRSAFLASRQTIYHAVIDFQSSYRNNPVQAFNYSEIAKSRDLLDALSESNSRKSSDEQLALSLSSGARPLTLNQVQRALPAQAQIVSYIVGEQRLMMWLVTRDNFFFTSVSIRADDLRRLITNYLANLRARRNIETLNLQAAELYKLLISPLADKFQQDRTLCVVPDGILSQLPFSALIDPDAHHYLIEDFPLLVTPSASVLTRTIATSRTKPVSQDEAFLGVGNPRFNPQRFPGLVALPSADDEIKHAM